MSKFFFIFCTLFLSSFQKKTKKAIWIGFWTFIFTVPLFGESRILVLSQGWSFSPGIYQPDSKDSMPALEVSFPFVWNSTLGKSEGFGVFQQFLSNESLQCKAGDLLGFKIHDVSSSAKIFWNQKLVGSIGKTSSSGEVYSPSYQTRVLPLVCQEGQNEITLEVSNFSHFKGGIWRAPSIGPWNEIIPENLLLQSLSALLAGAIGMMSVYHMILFFWRRKDKENFYFSLICFLLLLRTLLTGERIAYNLLEQHFGWEFLLRVEFLTFYATPALFLWFFYFLFPRTHNFKAILFLSFASILFSCFALFLPTLVFTDWNPFFLIPLAFQGIYSIGILVQETILENRDAKFILAGLLVLLGTVTLDICSSFQWIDLFEVTPYGSFGFIIFLSITVSGKFQDALKTIESQSLKLLHLDKLKDEFLATTSHELKTPLVGMIGIAESMLDGIGGDLNLEQKENLKMVVSSGKRLSSLVDDLLDFSRLKNNKLALHTKSVDLRQVCTVVLEALRVYSEPKGLQIFNNIPKNFPLVQADEDRLQQIFYNLLGNAIKFCPKGSVIISAVLQKQFALVTVSDTGIGIPATNLQTIFYSYEQLDSLESRKGSGIGLGLAITKTLVELHSGKISCESTLGVGSEFSFSIPLADSENSESGFRDTESNSYPFSEEKEIPNLQMFEEEVLEIQEIQKTKVKILIVDDESLSRQFIKNHLTLFGCEVWESSNGMDALDLLHKQGNFDVIILDIIMPGMSGYEVCRLVRQNHSLYELPILFLASKNQVLDLVSALEVGGNDFVSKPVDKLELITRTKNLILIRQAVKEQSKLQAIQNELKIARNLQSSILPREKPELDGLSISFHYEPIDSVGGDYFDFHPIAKTEIGILVGDVSGHGIPAALVSAMLKIAYSTEADHAKNPAEILKRINTILLGKMQGAFLTASAIYINREANQLLHARAGHPPLIVLRRHSRECLTSQPEGTIIGFTDSIRLSVDTISLLPQDRIVLYTDGFYEARNKSGEMLGLPRWQQLLLEVMDLPIEEAKSEIQKKIRKFTGKGPLDDDLTLVLIDVL